MANKKSTADIIKAARAAEKAGKTVDHGTVIAELAQNNTHQREKAQAYRAAEKGDAIRKALENARKREEREKAAAEFRSSIGEMQAEFGIRGKNSFESRSPVLTQRQLDTAAVSHAAKEKQAATKAYDDYQKSGERKANVDEATNEILKKVFGNLGAGNVDLALQNAPRQMLEAETRGKELEARKDYAENQERAAKDTKLLHEDLEELRSWSQEDRAGLEAYIREENGRIYEGSGERLSLNTNPESTALIKKYGMEKVREMAESLTRSRNLVNAQTLAAQASRNAGKGTLNAIGHSVGSVGANVLGSFTGPVGYIGELAGTTGRYTTLDPNNMGQLPSVYSGAVREQVAKDIEGDGNFAGKVGATLYKAGMGAADTVARGVMGGGSKVLSLGMAAGQSFGNTVSQASRQGASPGQAMMLGAVNAGIEAATEYIPLDELLKTAKTGSAGVKAVLTNVLKQAGIEATTEEISLMGTTLAEAAILREKSGYNQQIQNAIANGASYQQAKLEADRALMQEAGETAIVSALSGAMSTAGAEVSAKVPQIQQTAQDKLQETAGWIADAMHQAKQNRQGQKAQTEAVASDPQTTKEKLDAAIQEAMGVKKNTAESEETTVNVRSAGTAITEENKAKNTLSYTLATNLGTIQDMEPVSHLSGKEFKKQEGVSLPDQIRNFFKKLGNKVTRSGFGDVSLNEYGVGGMLNHRPLNRAKLVSLAAVPEVISKGRQIDYDPNWKGRGYETYIFAAPVKVSGNDVYVAAVVNKNPDNKFYLSEMVDSNGNYVRIEESPSGNSKYGATDGAGIPGRADAPLGPEGLPEESIPSATRAEPTSLPKNSIPNRGGIVNENRSGNHPQGVDIEKQSTEGGQRAENGIPGDFEAMGAASAGFSPFSHMQYEYGNIPEGENPVRPDDMPVSTDGTDRISYTARTVKGAAATPESFIGDLENLVVSGGMSYIPIRNDETAQKAGERIRQVGWESARTDWAADVRSGKSGADLTATGAILLNNAANAGDKQAWLEILDDYRKLGTNTAQGLQAFRILKKLAPEDQLYMVRRSVDQMVRDMHLETEITIDEDLEKAYREAETEEARDQALEAIQQNVADQIPSTAMDKWTALRYLNMLGNFRTQVRNITGNVGAKVTYLAKDEIAATLETVASAVSGGKFQRTKVHKVRKGLKQAAAKDFDSIQGAVLDGGKYNDAGSASSEFAQGVQDKRRIFKSDNKVADTLLKPMEGYRRATNWAMNTGDIVFAKGAYARAMAGYLQANGVKGDSFEGISEAMLDKAREYAIREAQEATFRDNNMVSSWISKVGRRRDTPKAAQMVAEGVLPFRKTPANVLVRAEEFSPLGLLNSAVKTVQGVNGEATGAEVINSWAKSLTGTGLFILGAALGDMGYLTGGPDTDEEKDEFDELNGYQNYALQLPDGTNLTIDFLSPTAMPLFMGAQLAKIIEDGGYTLADFESMFTSLADPMIQMSMLQGVNDTIDNIKYSENNLGQMLMNATMSYLTQGLTNTMLGQLERSTEDSRMTTYVDKDSNVPAWLQRQLGKMSAKTPGWDYQQMPYLNAWGQEEKNPEGVKDYLYNLFSPSYIDKAEVDKVAQELYRLHEAQSDINVFPQSPEASLTYTDKDGQRHEDVNLSMEQLQKLKQVEGQTQAKLVADLVNSSDYQALSDERKAKAISLAYDYAREQGRVEAISDYAGYSDSWMEGIDGKEVGAIVNKVATADFSDAMSALTESWSNGREDSKAREALESAYQVYKELGSDAQKDIRENASGRLGYYLEARTKGIKTETFIDLYKTYWEIDQSDAKTADKAQKWAYALERAEESRKINASQKAALKESMVYYQMFPAETEKFDQLTEGGLSAKDAQDLGYLLKGIEPQAGYKEVRDIQKAETIMESNLSEADKIAALKIYGSDAQDAKLEEMTAMGFSAADYVEAWRIYADASGRGKKYRTIETYRKQFGVSEDTARAIYEIYG